MCKKTPSFTKEEQNGGMTNESSRGNSKKESWFFYLISGWSYSQESFAISDLDYIIWIG